MFGKVATMMRMSEAAVVVQNLLEYHCRGTQAGQNAAKIANMLVQRVHDLRPEVVQGKKGTRPHKASLAAAALAVGLGKVADVPEQRDQILAALRELLFEVQTKPHLYALSLVDHALLEGAEEAMRAVEGCSDYSE